MSTAINTRQAFMLAILSVIIVALWGCNNPRQSDDIAQLEKLDNNADGTKSHEGEPSKDSDSKASKIENFEQLDPDIRAFQPNQFNNVLNAPFSEYGTEFDDISYHILKDYVQHKRVVPDNITIRTDGLLNYFKYDYPEPEKDEPFSITTELIQTPWNKDTQLLLIGMQTPKLTDVPKSNIVFYFSNFEEFNGYSLFNLFLNAIDQVLDNFSENDTISIVSSIHVHNVLVSGVSPNTLKKMIHNEREKWVNNIKFSSMLLDELPNGFEAVNQEAEKYYIKEGNNRIILLSGFDYYSTLLYDQNSIDGSFYALSKLQDRFSMSLMGVMQHYPIDYTMYKELAKIANAKLFYFTDNQESSRHAFLEERNSAFLTSLTNVNFKIDFNPEIVKGYRLIGYEYPNNAFTQYVEKRGNKLAYNQQMTALYEIVPADSNVEVAKAVANYHTTEQIPSDAIAILSARYTENEDIIREIKKPISSQVSSQMSENIQFAAAVAEIGMIVNNSEFKGTSTYESAYQLISPLHRVQSDPSRAEFFEMVQDMPNLISLTQKETLARLEREKQQKEWEQRQREKKEIRQQQIARFGGVPSVKFKIPEVSGSIDKRIIQKVVRRYQDELLACYENQVLKMKGLYGRVVPMWIITAKGDVSKVIIKESTIKNRKVENCVVNAIKHWRFPQPKNGGSVSVQYPFDFELSPK